VAVSNVVTDSGRAGHPCPVGSSSLALSLDPNGSAEEPRPAAPSSSSASSSASRPRPTPSFDDVYEQTFDFAWRSARRLGVATSAVDDIVQDAFLVVHRRLPEFEGRSSVRTWVFGILFRVVSDHRRTLRRKGGLSELPHDDVLSGHGRGPAESLERRQAADVLHALLDELDDEKRTVFVLAELEELSAPEIAEMLGVPANTVYSRLRAAREGFERALARHRAREQGTLDRGKERR
jgi:RNA polymerase sigma-70 factor (ECF subfamily)